MSCPVCGAPASADYRPFCSRRCAYVDLGRWLSDEEDPGGDAGGDEPGEGDGEARS